MSNLTGLLCANKIQPRKNTVTCVAVVAAVKAQPKQYAEPLYSCNVKIYEHSPHRHRRSQVPKGHHHSSTNYTLTL